MQICIITYMNDIYIYHIPINIRVFDVMNDRGLTKGLTIPET